MPDAPRIAKLSAVVNGGEYSAEGVVMNMEVNHFPTVNVTLHNKADDVVRSALASSTLADIAKLQAQRLAGRSSTDLSVNVDDGRGGSTQFDGFIAAPTLATSRSGYAKQLTGLGVAAVLDAMDLSIYEAGSVRQLAENDLTGTGGEQLDPIPEASDGNIIGLISAVTDVLVGNFETTLNSKSQAGTKALMQRQHEINSGLPLQTWEQILSDSEVEFSTWEDVFKQHPNAAAVMTNALKSIMTNRTTGFWNTVRMLMSSFQMHYIPSFQGPGRFERADTKVGKTGGSLRVSGARVDVSDGSPYILQPGGVVMMAQAVRPQLAENAVDSGDDSIVAYAPDPIASGFIQKISPPLWLIGPDGAPILGSEVDQAQDSSGKNLSLADYIQRRKGNAEFMEKVGTVVGGALTELCEVMFKELQLADSSVSLRMPLDLSISDRIGERLSITVLDSSGASSGSFEAFVHGVTHSIELRAGKELDSFTSVRCTHVAY